MTSHNTFLIGAAIMFLTGIGIPVMAAINGGLGRELGSATAATAVLFAAGLLFALAALMTTGAPDWSRFGDATPFRFFGAFFVVSYVLAVTWFAPRIGVGNAIFFVLLGQLVAAAAIDHFGWLGSTRFPITPQRAIGLVVMALGVYLAKRST